MLRRIILSLCVVAFSVVVNLAQAQEFSADISNLKKEAGELHKIYVSSSKVRIETSGKSGLSALILDTTNQKNIAIMSERHMYMEMPYGQSMPMAQNFWRPLDANNACPQWKEFAEQVADKSKSGKRLASCSKVGGETLNGRSVVKYEGTDTDGKVGYVWVDTKVRCVVKVLGSEGNGFEMRNIQEGALPASLFEVPAGYTKMDMGGMMQHQ